MQLRSEATNGRQLLLSKPLAAHADINKDRLAKRRIVADVAVTFLIRAIKHNLNPHGGLHGVFSPSFSSSRRKELLKELRTKRIVTRCIK